MMEPEDIAPEKVVIEMKASPSRADEKDKPAEIIASTEEKPPNPPKRDYAVEKDEGYVSEQKAKTRGSFPRPHFIYKPEHPETWMGCIRITLVVFNLFIWLLGAAITALGIWIKTDKEFWKIQSNLDVTQFTAASWVLIFIGIFIMLIGFIGCYGAMMSKMCFLIIFVIIVCIILVMEIIVMALVWTAVSNKNVLADVKLKAKTAMNEMMEDDKKREFIELIQAKLHCCGVDGPGDYGIDSGKVKPIPRSCTDKETGSPYTLGCYDAIVTYLKGKAAVVGGIAVAVFLLQLGALVFSICIICGLKQAGNAVI